MKLKEAIAWCASVVVVVATAIFFLFTTFQTSADSTKMSSYFDSRLERMEQKIDKILERH